MELDQLYAFQAVAQEGSIAGGARLIGVSAASVSRAVHLLENELGVSLIQRSGRSVCLTMEGRRIAERVRVIVEEAQGLRSAVEEVSSVQGGILQIGCTTALATGRVVEAVRGFLERFPRVRVVVHSDEHSASVLEMVSEGLCEVGFVGANVHEGSISALKVGKEQLAIVGPEGSMPKGAFGDPESALWLGELEAEPWISGPVGSSLREPLERAFRSLGLRPRVVVETDHRDMVPGLVLGGVGFALLPRRIALELGAAGATLIKAWPVIDVDTTIIYKNGMLSSLGTAFIKVVQVLQACACV